MLTEAPNCNRCINRLCGFEPLLFRPTTSRRDRHDRRPAHEVMLSTCLARTTRQTRQRCLDHDITHGAHVTRFFFQTLSPTPLRANRPPVTANVRVFVPTKKEGETRPNVDIRNHQNDNPIVRGRARKDSIRQWSVPAPPAKSSSQFVGCRQFRGHYRA